jgi:hypothetical protein
MYQRFNPISVVATTEVKHWNYFFTDLKPRGYTVTTSIMRVIVASTFNTSCATQYVGTGNKVDRTPPLCDCHE